MKAISLTFNQYDLIIHPFQSAGANGVVGMVQNAIIKKSQSFHKLPQR